MINVGKDQEQVYKEAINYLLETNKPKNNIGKCLEEVIELSEVLVKFVTKVEEHQPKREKLVEEMGDVLLRINVLIKQFDIKEEVIERIITKSKQLLKYADEGKYVGGM